MNTTNTNPSPTTSTTTTSPSSSSAMEIDILVNKSFLVLDEIEETYLSLLEKSIFSITSLSQKEEKSKISKLEFIIQQRIKYVESNLGYIHSLLSDEDKTKSDLINRINQLGFDQKRTVAAFKALQHKKLERERIEKEQEELLTRRFTSTTDTTTDPVNCVVNLSDSANIPSDTSKLNNNNNNNNKAGNINSQRSVALNMSKLRNQKPLVKRVRTRYLNFSTDFLGMTKMFLKYSCVDLIIFLASVLVIFMLIFCYLIWKNAASQM